MLNKTTVEIDTRQLQNIPVPYEKAKLMRATTYFLGTLLGRFHSAHVSMPGGCNLGDRPSTSTSSVSRRSALSTRSTAEW